MKKAVIHIIDTHLSDGEKYTCELTTAGTLDFLDGAYILTYDETDTELAGCTTTLKVDKNKTVTMTRSGKYNTELILEKERRHSCFYNTPFGELMMGIYAKSIESEMTENGGKLRFCYTIDFNNDLASENDLSISVAVKEND